MGYGDYGGEEREEEDMGYERSEEGLELGCGEVVPSLVMACDGQFLSTTISDFRIAGGEAVAGE